MPSERWSTSRDETHRGYAVGDVILGKYALERMLAEGGMGSVWFARNVVLDAPVAIKLLRPETDTAETRHRLLNEARVEAKLEHPAIVRVFDFGHTEFGDPFVVMELLDGPSLGELLHRQRRLSPAAAVQILLPIVDALGCAHERGVVHRDVKPDNIFLAREARRMQPKLVDFGIATVDDGDASSTRVVMGTPGYMSPEQARGESNVDSRADVWAMGVVLYEAVSGEACFSGETAQAVLLATLSHEVPPFEEFNAGEASLWPIVCRALEKDREQRFQSMQDFGAALAEWLAAQGATEDACGELLSRNWSVPLRLVTPVPTVGRSPQALSYDLAGPDSESPLPEEQRSSFEPVPSSPTLTLASPLRRRRHSLKIAAFAAVALLGGFAVAMQSVARIGHVELGAPHAIAPAAWHPREAAPLPEGIEPTEPVVAIAAAPEPVTARRRPSRAKAADSRAIAADLPRRSANPSPPPTPRDDVQDLKEPYR